jgi:hypothetical protein
MRGWMLLGLGVQMLRLTIPRHHLTRQLFPKARSTERGSLAIWDVSTIRPDETNSRVAPSAGEVGIHVRRPIRRPQDHGPRSLLTARLILDRRRSTYCSAKCGNKVKSGDSGSARRRRPKSSRRCSAPRWRASQVIARFDPVWFEVTTSRNPRRQPSAAALRATGSVWSRKYLLDLARRDSQHGQRSLNVLSGAHKRTEGGRLWSIPCRVG